MNCIECECYICLNQYECGECGNCGREYVHCGGCEDYVEDIDKTLDDIEKSMLSEYETESD